MRIIFVENISRSVESCFEGCWKVQMLVEIRKQRKITRKMIIFKISISIDFYLDFIKINIGENITFPALGISIFF